LGYYKTGARLRNEPYAEYYDKSSAELALSLYHWEFDYFQYSLP
jgi:hypothetical protein